MNEELSAGEYAELERLLKKAMAAGAITVTLNAESFVQSFTGGIVSAIKEYEIEKSMTYRFPGKDADEVEE